MKRAVKKLWIEVCFEQGNGDKEARMGAKNSRVHCLELLFIFYLFVCGRPSRDFHDVLCAFKIFTVAFLYHLIIITLAHMLE